jgi:2-oxoglutarate ferredoxin oxidoreductase subunit delta
LPNFSDGDPEVDMSDKARGVETVDAVYGERKITIIPKYCKGCEICIKMCPTQVLDLKDFKVHVVNIEACTECMLCEVRCPDFAIEVHESGKKGSAK